MGAEQGNGRREAEREARSWELVGAGERRRGPERAVCEDYALVGGNVAVVADGVGSSSHSDEASERAAKAVCHSLNTGPGVPVWETSAARGRMHRAFEAASAAVATIQTGEEKGANTTLSALCFFYDPKRLALRAVTGNKGDSRWYRWRGNRLAQLTVDQTLFNLAADLWEHYLPDRESLRRRSARADITKEEIEELHQNIEKAIRRLSDSTDSDDDVAQAQLVRAQRARINVWHMLTRLFTDKSGNSRTLSVRELSGTITDSVSAHHDTAPAVAAHDVEADDWYLGCSDGLYGAATDAQLEAMVRLLIEQGKTPEEVAAGLQAWVAPVASDDVTVVLVRPQRKIPGG